VIAVILAAGRGGRLSGVLGDRPKCLARVGDKTLLERQIASIRSLGISDIAVVTGFRGDDVQRVAGGGVQVVHNARYSVTNSLYSLWLARDLLTDGFVVFNCDVLFAPDMLELLLNSHHEDAALVCTRDEATTYGEEEMKVAIEHGLVKAMSKELTVDEAAGENVGIVKFGAAGAHVLCEELRRLVAEGKTREWLPRAFSSFCNRRPLHVVDTAGWPWIEIDVPEDYWRACREVLPAIDRLSVRTPLKRTAPAAADGPAATLRNERNLRHV
jgi:choline kinase